MKTAEKRDYTTDIQRKSQLRAVGLFCALSNYRDETIPMDDLLKRFVQDHSTVVAVVNLTMRIPPDSYNPSIHLDLFVNMMRSLKYFLTFADMVQVQRFVERAK